MIKLEIMDESMYYIFFQGYQNDPALFIDEKSYQPFIYSKEWVKRYIEKNKSRSNISLAILLDEEIVGEILFKNIHDQIATLSIVLKNQNYIEKGIGTKAEKLAIEYGFSELHLTTILADTLKTNTRSAHVLEKVGFRKYKEDQDYYYYQISI